VATAASTHILTASSRSPIEYWHLLSLDAPTVAALWACALCTATHVVIPVPSILLLVLGTWLFYVADRILDSIRPADQLRLRERHSFHWAHRRLFVLVGLPVLFSLAWLSVSYLPRRSLQDSSQVLAAALAYFVVVHWGGAVIKRWFPKEMAVGVVLAAAVSVPAGSQLPSGLARSHFLAGVALLSALFWLNCFAIESWESGPRKDPLALRNDALNGHESRPARAWLAGNVRFVAFAVMATAAGFVAEDLRHHKAFTASSIYFSILISAAILFYLDGAQTRLSALRLRIAADAALLTPLLFLMLPRLLMLPKQLHGPQS